MVLECSGATMVDTEYGSIAKFVEANGEAMDSAEVTLAMLSGDAE
jgi:hypothetical protein